MSARGWAGITVALFVAVCGVIGLAQARREAATEDRIAAFEQRKRAHAEAVVELRPRALSLLRQFEATTPSDDHPEWAGRYGWSWTDLGGCFASTDHQEHLVLCADGDVVWWLGTGGPDTAEFVDCGRIRSVEPDRIVVEWTISPRTPHVLFDPWQPTALLGDELVRIEGQRFSHLLPAVRLGLLCVAGGRANPNVAAFAPQRGEWKGGAGHLVRQLDLDDARIPAPWNEYVRSVRLVAEATLIDGPHCVLRERVETTPLWKRLLGRPAGGWYQLTYEIPIGFDDGVRTGMRMQMGSDGDNSGIVESVSANSSRVRFVLPSLHWKSWATACTIQSIL